MPSPAPLPKYESANPPLDFQLLPRYPPNLICPDDLSGGCLVGAEASAGLFNG